MERKKPRPRYLFLKTSSALLITLMLPLAYNACGDFKSRKIDSLDSSSRSEDGNGLGPGGTNPGGSSPGEVEIPNPPVGTVEVPVELPQAKSCNDGSTRGGAKHGIRRLTKKEIVKTLMDLVGEPSWILREREDQYFGQLSDIEEVSDVTAYQELFSKQQLLDWVGIVDRITSEFAKDGYFGGSFISGCMREATPSASCLQSWVASIGRKIFRRPLGASEVSAISALAAGKQGPAAAQHILSFMLTSPDFLFHFEVGVEGGESNRVRLTDHETANRISYSLTGTYPDATLAGAADRGELKTLPQVDAHVRRILATDKAKEKLQAFFGDWLMLDAVPVPDAGALGWANVPTASSDLTEVRRVLLRELFDYETHVIWKRKGNFSDLMTLPISFPRSNTSSGSSIGAIYGVGGSSHNDAKDPTPFAAPDHPGLISRAAFLASAGRTTSPIRRGVKIKRRILCEELPSPNSIIIAERMNEPALFDSQKFANHQIVTNVTNKASCLGCHSQINPMGFAFEMFDTVGHKRTKETVLPVSGEILSYEVPNFKTWPLPGPANNLYIDAGLPTSFSGPAAIAQAIGDSDKAKACMTTHFFRHIERRQETSLDECAINEANELLRKGQPVIEMFIKSIANEDIFWRGTP